MREVAPSPYKALGSVVHEAQLEPLLVPEALGQGAPHVVRWEGLFPAVLKLSKHGLQTTSTGVSSMPTTANTPISPSDTVTPTPPAETHANRLLP